MSDSEVEDVEVPPPPAPASQNSFLLTPVVDRSLKPDDQEDDIPPPPPSIDNPEPENPVPSQVLEDLASPPRKTAREILKDDSEPSVPRRESKVAMSFAGDLTSNFDVVSGQVDSGIYSTKRVNAVLKKICALEIEYSKKLLQILEHEGTKSERIEQDGMKGYVHEWNEVLNIWKEVANHRAKSASQVIDSVCEPLRIFNEDADQKRRALLAQERKMSGEMQVARDKVVKGHDMCVKLIEGARQAQMDKKKLEEKDKDKKKNLGGQLMNSLVRKATQIQQKFTGTLEDLQKKGYETAVQYELDIGLSNERQKRYLKDDLPFIFNGMQDIEVKRLHQIKGRLISVVDLKEKEQQGAIVLFNKMRNVVTKIEPERDIVDFVEDWVHEHGAQPISLQPFSYELPRKPEDIKNGRLSGNPNSIFRTNLLRCMEIQSESHPSLHVPRIVPTLIKAIKELGGLQAEGIFRISADQVELEKFKEQVDNGEYDMKAITSPHMPAALLKTWLRELETPLIPAELYAPALEIGKSKASPDELKLSIGNILKQLPEVNQHVIEHLAELCQTISNQENSAVNKMNINNLAIVFAPSFLRNPSEDPIMLLQNSKFETRFAALILEYTSAP